VADLVLSDLRGLGIEAEEDSAADTLSGNAGNVFGRLDGGRDDLPTMLFCAHMDTVPVAGEVRPCVDGDVVRSDGTTILGADDKCGVAVLIESLARLRETHTPHAPLEALFTVGEETGLDGAKAFDASRLRSRIGYALDHSDPSSVVCGSPAKAKLRFLFCGSLKVTV